MLTLGLTEEETGLLREALETYLSNLRFEIADTDEADYRTTLKGRETVLRGILERLTQVHQNPL